jgi:hypothetical protein
VIALPASAPITVGLVQWGDPERIAPGDHNKLALKLGAKVDFEVFATENSNLSWRIEVNALYMRAVLLATLGRPADARDAFGRAIEFIDQKRPRANDADAADLGSFRVSIVQRAEALGE